MGTSNSIAQSRCPPAPHGFLGEETTRTAVVKTPMAETTTVRTITTRTITAGPTMVHSTAVPSCHTINCPHCPLFLNICPLLSTRSPVHPQTPSQITAPNLSTHRSSQSRHRSHACRASSTVPLACHCPHVSPWASPLPSPQPEEAEHLQRVVAAAEGRGGGRAEGGGGGRMKGGGGEGGRRRRRADTCVQLGARRQRA